jgi:hypothetical protein
MHRRTYYRLAGKAIAAQERLLGLEIDAIRRRFPGLASDENGFPSPHDVASRTKRERQSQPSCTSTALGSPAPRASITSR